MDLGCGKASSTDAQLLIPFQSPSHFSNCQSSPRVGKGKKHGQSTVYYIYTYTFYFHRIVWPQKIPIAFTKHLQYMYVNVNKHVIVSLMNLWINVDNTIEENDMPCQSLPTMIVHFTFNSSVHFWMKLNSTLYVNPAFPKYKFSSEECDKQFTKAYRFWHCPLQRGYQGHVLPSQ